MNIIAVADDMRVLQLYCDEQRDVAPHVRDHVEVNTMMEAFEADMQDLTYRYLITVR